MRTWIHRRLHEFDRDREHGYVAVFVALILTVLLMFAAFTVDFGSWYTRSAELKRAADAAALAGVVWMPEFDQAQQYALATAAKNGFVNGENNITVKVDDVSSNNRQLRVTIRDTKAKQFFSQLVTDKQSIGSSSLAEYVLPVPLGSPKNTFGTGDLLGGSDRENFWAAVNGYCAGHESGDKKLAKYESYSTSTSSSACQPSGSPASDNDYDPEGYLYAIDLPQDTSSLTLDVYDGEFNQNGTTTPEDIELAGNQTVTTTYKIYARNPTPLDLSNLTLVKTITVPTNSSSYVNQWVALNTWTNPKAGQYYVRVLTNAAGTETTNSRASNGFGLRAFTGASFATCSTITTAANYNANCPQVHAVSDMSIYANLSGSTADFYLAQIDPIHAGKTMRINLFDAGEGANGIQILDPNGNPTAFSWSMSCNPPTPPSGGCSGTASGASPSLDVSGTGTQPYTGLRSTSKYNDRFITIDIPLPSNYSTVYAGQVWWKVRYNVGSSPTDRTTWSVNIVGDPVHLLK